MDSSEQMVLDAGIKQIIIKDSSDTPRVFIKQSNISSPSGTSATAVINPLSTYSFGAGEQFTIGSIDVSEYTYDTTGFYVSQPGTYTISSVNWGTGGGIYAQADMNFNGYLSLYMQAVIYNTDDLTGTYIGGIGLGSLTGGGIYTAGDEDNTYFYNGGTLSLTFPAPGTYYVHTYLAVYGYISGGTVTLSGADNPASNTFTIQQSQTELGQDGFLVVADANNYAKIQRTTTDPIIDIKTNGTTPGLRITNANGSASAKAIEILAGDLTLSGAGNNIMVNGGYIGTENTAGGIRFQTDGSNSVLIGQNWPSQASNVATARLRIGTKLGISGRELILSPNSRTQA